jgi:hypothetical protein
MTEEPSNSCTVNAIRMFNKQKQIQAIQISVNSDFLLFDEAKR